MKLSDWMKKNKVTQMELARRMGTDQAHVSALVNQKAMGAKPFMPKAETILLISEITDGRVTLPDWVPAKKATRSKR